MGEINVDYNAEDIWNIHRLIVSEMEERDIDHDTPLKPRQMLSENKTNIIDKLDDIDDRIIVHDFASVVGSVVEGKGEPEDLDLLLRMNHPIEFAEYIKRAAKESMRKELEKHDIDLDVHEFEESPGPHSSYYPVWDLALIRRDCKDNEIVEYSEELQSFPFEPQKPNDENPYDLDKILDDIDYDNDYFIEKKADGFHVLVKKTDDGADVYTEEKKEVSGLDSFLDKAEQMSDNDFIIDGELIWRGDGDSRRQLMKFIEDTDELDDDVGLYVWDVIKYDDEDLKDMPLSERIEYIDKLDMTDNIEEIPRDKVSTKGELEDAIEEMKDKENSEGAVIKDVDSKYKPGSKNDDWIKFRKTSTFKARVIDRDKTENNNYKYNYGIDLNEHEQNIVSNEVIVDVEGEKVHDLGNTFVTEEGGADQGDIIEIRCEEIWRHEYSDGDVEYSVHKPRLSSIRDDIESTSELEDLDNIVSSLGAVVKEEENSETLQDDEEGTTRSDRAKKFWKNNWHKMYNKNGEGNFVFHMHWRGLDEDETDMSHKELIEQGEHSIHGDLRWSVSSDKNAGFTVFEGDPEDIPENEKSKLIYMAKNKGEEKFDKLQGQFKLAQPSKWVDYAIDNPKVHEPGDVGTTSDSYSKFFALDDGDYELGVMHKHYVELFVDGDEMNGRCTMMYAPVGDSRKWLIDFPEDQEPTAKSKTLDDQVKELRESDTQHKHLIWNNPNTDDDPEKIDISDYKIDDEENIEDEWVIDQVAERLVSNPFWEKEKEITREKSVDVDLDRGEWVIQKHTIQDKEHFDVRLSSGDKVYSFFYKDNTLYPKGEHPKMLMEVEGSLPTKREEFRELVGSFQIVESGKYRKEEENIVLLNEKEKVGVIDTKKMKIER